NNTGGTTPGSNDVVASNNTTNNTTGSNDVVAPTPDAAPVATTNTNDDIKLECLRLKAAKNWTGLEECTTRLAATDAATAKGLRATAISENKAETTLRNLNDALKKVDIKAARTAFNAIGEDSVYKQEAKEAFLPAEAQLVNDYEERARSAAADKNCKQVDKIVAEARKLGVEAKARAVKCTPETATSKPSGGNTGGGTTTNNGGSSTSSPPDSKCDAEALEAKGQDLLQTGMDAAALNQLEAAYRCKPNANLLKLSFLASCRSKNAAKAKLYYSKIPNAPASITQICIRNGIQIP
ncbi:MAG TPA: hypothetical protein VM513_33005, partial [Kofleriaceae bacterium]|nr:hypothetical protein [Kofleriaceae bacterium]